MIWYLIAPTWQITAVMIWWKCEIIRLLCVCVCVIICSYFQYVPRGSEGPQSHSHKFTSTVSSWTSGKWCSEESVFVSFNLELRVGASPLYMWNTSVNMNNVIFIKLKQLFKVSNQPALKTKSRHLTSTWEQPTETNLIWNRDSSNTWLRKKTTQKPHVQFQAQDPEFEDHWLTKH